MKRPDGTEEVRQVKNFHIQWQDAHGKTRRMKAGPTKALARELLAKMETEVAKEKAGLPSQNLAKISVECLRNQYLMVEKSRTCPEYLSALSDRLHTVLQNIGAISVRDISPDRVETFLIQLEEKRDLSPRTTNLYLQAIKGMLNWAVDMRIIPYNPIACLKPRRAAEDRKKRRALTEEELDRLLKVAPKGSLIRTQQNCRTLDLPPNVQEECLYRGERNALIYRMLVYTGLRISKELGQLRWADVDLNEGTINLRPELTKNKKGGIIKMPPRLTQMLRDWRARHAHLEPTERVISIPDSILRRAFYQDLELAGIPRVDAAGRSVDLHALRHTYCTLLIKSGADIKTVQTLMRHSTPALTLGIYSHYDQRRLDEAVAKLPEVGRDEEGKTYQAAAG
jgi:integrase